MAEEDQSSIRFRKNIKEEFGKVTSTISSEVRGAAATVTSGISDVVGPEMAQLASSVSNLGKSMASSILGIFKKSDESAGEKKTNKFLGSILEHFKKQEKRLARATPDKKRSWLDKSLLAMVTLVGLAIGAVIRKFVLPFQLLFKVVKPFFKLFGFIGKFMGKITGGGLVVRIAKWIDDIPLLGSFLSSISKGFKLLGWPLTIIMGMIDFVRGYMAAEGDILEKMKAGLTAAFVGFVELPVKLIGWIADWILKAFGMEIEGGAGAVMMAKITETFSWIFDKLVGIFSAIGGIVDWFKDKLANIPGIGRLGKWLAKKLGATEKTSGTPTTTASTGAIDAIRADRITTAKAKEDQRMEEQRKRDAALAKTGETMTTAVGDQTTIISSMTKKEAPIVEVPHHVDNYLLGTAVGGF